MNVQTVKIKEFKILNDFEAEINGNHILLCGDNGVGKSSLIQFLKIALGDQSNIPPNAKGKGEVVFDHNGNALTCKVSFKDGKPVVKVSGHGISIDNNKGAIASLFGAVDFNPEKFVELSKTSKGRKEQLDEFKSTLDPDFIKGIAEFQANVKNNYDSRTELNKDLTKLKGSVALHPLNNLPNYELEKFQEVDTVAVMEQLTFANSKNEKFTKVSDGIETRKKAIQEKINKIAELNKQIDDLNLEIKTVGKEVEDGNKWLKENPKVDTSVIEKTISDASEINKKAASAKQLIEDRAKIEKYTEEAGELTANIESSTEAIANAIREMESPVEDLSFDDEQLIYKGVPVSPDSLSTSEIMELGIRLQMVKNPNLGILFIQRGESLGTDRLKLIKELADNEGWQIIMEQVERGKKQLEIEIMAND